MSCADLSKNRKGFLVFRAKIEPKFLNLPISHVLSRTVFLSRLRFPQETFVLTRIHPRLWWRRSGGGTYVRAALKLSWVKVTAKTEVLLLG